jgi:hypothetical protein
MPKILFNQGLSLVNMAYIETNGIRIRKKRRKWLTASLLTSLIAIMALIISGISVYSTYYFSMQNGKLTNELYNLQNSLYNFSPFIFSNYTSSTLNSLYCERNDTLAILDGSVNIDLKVISPYDGYLTIQAKTFNFTSINGYNISNYINSNYIDSPQPVQDLATMPHQYWISANSIKSITDKLVIQLIVDLKPNCLPLTGITLDLGYLTFEASLFAARLNQTIKTQNCTANVFGTFTPTSS